MVGEKLGISSVIFAMCGAGAFNVAITRTPISTGVILVCLCGQVEILMPLMVSILVAFYITMPFKLVMSQKDRQDISWIEKDELRRRGTSINDESSNEQLVLDSQIYNVNYNFNTENEEYVHLFLN